MFKSDKPKMSLFFCCRSEWRDLISSSLSSITDTILIKRDRQILETLLLLLLPEPDDMLDCCFRQYLCSRKYTQINKSLKTCVLLFVLQLQRFVVLPQSVALFGEGDVSRLQLFQQPLALVEPAQENDLLHT